MAVAKKGAAAAAPNFKNKRETVFKLKKETSGAVQYEEVNENGSKKTDMDGAVMGSMYLRKATLKGPAPELVKLTVEW